MSPRFGRIVERLCVPWGGSLMVTPDGFLSEPPEGLLGFLTGQALGPPDGLEPVAAAAASGALVVLGEPGVGKSTSLRRLVANLPAWEDAAAEENGLAWVDLIDVDEETFGEVVVAPLQRLPLLPGEDRLDQAVEPEQAVAARLTLVLDGVDECPLEPKRLVGRLRRSLARRDLGRLHLLVGCRAADYPPGLHEFLTSLLAHLRVVELAPLTRSNAAALTEDRGVDPDAFLAAVVAAGAGALAAIPLTLDLLLRLYQRDGHLVDNAAALFEQGVLVLADEPDDDRRPHELLAGSAPQRAAVAARISASLLLCGKAAVWSGQIGEVPESDVPDGSLAGGSEHAAAGPFDVTPGLLAASLDTALFSSRGPSRLGLAHATFASYLAARHLIDHQLPEQQVRSLLTGASELGRDSIHPPLRELAAWLVALDPSRTAWLAGIDPYNIAVHAAVIESPGVRELLVRRLLEQADRVALLDRPWTRPRWSLSHPGLADQLRPVLVAAVADDPTGRPSRQQVDLAVQLARETDTAALVDELCKVAAEQGWDGYLRSWAARAAADLDRDRAASRLLGLLQELSAEADPDDELRAEILAACWPERLSVDELLAALTPPRNQDLFGAYWSLRHGLPEQLREQDLPAVLEWARQNLGPGTLEAKVDTEIPTPPDGGTASADGSTQPNADKSAFTPAELSDHDAELLDALIDRALTGPGGAARIPAAAWLLSARLAAHYALIPAPVDLVDTSGQEPSSVRTLRRDLVAALLALTKNEHEAYLLAYGWRQRQRPLRVSRSQEQAGGDDLVRADSTSLLRPDDLDWLLQLDATADDATAARLHVLIRTVFTPMDPAAQELALQHKGTRVWAKVFAPYFQAVDLTSPAAQRARRQNELLATKSEELPWSGRDEFTSTQRDRLRQAVSGDGTAFWQLCHALQADPNTGTLRVRHDDDLTTWPGGAVLEDGWREPLLTAATHYLLSEHPHADEWLGTDRYDRRAWAGYLALALLARHGLLDTVAPATWARWAPAILWWWTVPSGTGDRKLKRDLLTRVASAAPDALVDPALRILRGRQDASSRRGELRALDVAWTPPLAEALAGELDALAGELVSGSDRTKALDATLRTAKSHLDAASVSTQPSLSGTAETPEQQAARQELQQAQDGVNALLETVGLLGGLLVNNGHPYGIDACRRLVEAVPANQSELLRSAALSAAVTLLHADARTHWPSVLATARADPNWGDDLAAALADDRADSSLFDQLEEVDLAELYILLSERYPPEADAVPTGMHWVSSEERVRQWRDNVVQALAGRGSAAAVRQLAALVGRWPDRTSLKAHLLWAEERQQEAAWSPPTLAELQALLADRRRRLVRNATELSDLIVDVLREVTLSVPQHGQLLWDMHRASQPPTGTNEGTRLAAGSTESTAQGQRQVFWRPKDEHALSAYLKDQLELRLASSAVVVNREVLVRQTSPSGAGNRVDLLVEATALFGAVTTALAAAESEFHAVRVVIEVKGCWNNQLLTAMRDQLVNDYLPEAHAKHGVYVVGWYPVEQWNDPDDQRRTATARHDRDQTASELKRQATDLSQTQGLDLRAVVIDIPRPSPSDRNA